PRRVTKVLEVKAPARSLYWRAAVLDDFARDRWVEAPPRRADALEPPAAADRRRLLRQDVRVLALADTHLVGASVPVAYAAGEAPAARGDGRRASRPRALRPPRTDGSRGRRTRAVAVRRGGRARVLVPGRRRLPLHEPSRGLPGRAARRVRRPDAGGVLPVL